MADLEQKIEKPPLPLSHPVTLHLSESWAEKQNSYQHLKKCKIGFIVAVEGACLSCLIIFNLSSDNTDSKFKTKPIYGDLDQHIDYSQSQFDSYLRNLTVKQARLISK